MLLVAQGKNLLRNEHKIRFRVAHLLQLHLKRVDKFRRLGQIYFNAIVAFVQHFFKEVARRSSFLTPIRTNVFDPHRTKVGIKQD